MAKTLKLGQRVEGGRTKTADYDRGRIIEVDRKTKTARVMWDSGVIAPRTFDAVEVIGPRGPNGEYKVR
jgi:hypothetical protein